MSDQSANYWDAWYHDVPRLIKQTDIIYRRLVEAGKPDKVTITRDKIIELREWQPARRLIEQNFTRVLTELNVFYVPKIFKPGPMVVFPQRDLDGQFTRAQTKPLYTLMINQKTGKPAKYVKIGVGKKDFKGPVWLGNDLCTLRRIIELQAAIVVEGPFDLLACRLLCPDIPTLCSMTKTLGAEQQAYLRLLGVKNLYLLFDNEAPKAGKDIGHGNLSMRLLQTSIKTMNVEMLLCPSSDPSECLKNPIKARTLRTLLLDTAA